MNIDEAIERIDRLIGAVEAEMPIISEEIATNAMALIINRIQQEGLQGRFYSENELPKFFFHDRELNEGGRRLLRNKKKKGISYKEWRAANGLQVGHVDLTYSGRMFQNISVTGTVRIGDRFVTIVGGVDKEVKDKLIWNARRFGDFFMVNDAEKRELEVLASKRFNDLIKRIL